MVLYRSNSPSINKEQGQLKIEFQCKCGLFPILHECTFIRLINPAVDSIPLKQPREPYCYCFMSLWYRDSFASRKSSWKVSKMS